MYHHYKSLREEKEHWPNIFLYFSQELTNELMAEIGNLFGVYSSLHIVYYELHQLSNYFITLYLKILYKIYYIENYYYIDDNTN